MAGPRFNDGALDLVEREARAAALNGSGPEALHLRDYLRVLRARLWALAGVFVLVVGLVAIGTFASTPIYRATTLLLIEPKTVNIANVQGAYDPIQTGMSLLEYYRTQYELLRSRRVLEPVAAALGVAAREEFQGRDPLENFSKTVSVEPLRDSRLVRVSVESSDRDFATRAANAIVEQYIDDSRGRSLGVSDAGLKRLRDKERELRPKYEEAARTLQAFKEQNDLVAIDETQAVVLHQLKALTEDLSKARAARAEAEGNVEAVQAALAEGATAGSLPQMETSRVIEGLKLEIAKAEQDRDEMRKRYLPEHPQVRAAEARVALVRIRLAAEEREIIAAVGNKHKAALAREREIAAEVEKAKGEVAELGRKAIRYRLLKEEADTLSSSYKSISQRIEEIDVAVATGAKENNLFVIDRALLPVSAVKPRKALNLGLGVLFGLLAGVGFCFLLEYLDNTIKGKDDVERLLSWPVLGFVPPVAEHDPEHAGPPELAAVANPRSALAESFRTIRTGLGFTVPPDAPRAIVVTSAAPRDGKTFVSVNLAFAFAQTGKRVLLVDADLRRPRIHDVFGNEGPEGGLSTTLASLAGAADGGAPLEAARRTQVEMLDILPAGPLPPNPAELLGTDAMKRFLDAALKSYDWVILDAPPVATVVDAAVLLAAAPHCVFVARAFATDKHGAARAREILDQAPGRVAGVVLNTIDVPSGGNHGYYGYGTYKSGYYAHAGNGNGNGGTGNGNGNGNGGGHKVKAKAGGP